MSHSWSLTVSKYLSLSSATMCTEKLFLKQNLYVSCRKETGCCVVIFEIKITLICVIIYNKYNIDQIYKYLAAKQKIEINRRKFCSIFQDFKIWVFQNFGWFQSFYPRPADSIGHLGVPPSSLPPSKKIQIQIIWIN